MQKGWKSGVIEQYRADDNDTGSADVQVAVLTERVKHLTEHLKVHKKDFATRRGLLKMVGQRRRLLRYIAREDHERYVKLIESLGIRR